MSKIHLVTGYAGEPHITADDHGKFNASIFGSGDYVLSVGDKFAATVIASNTVQVQGGQLLMNGRHAISETAVDLTIESGTVGMKRRDLIVARYTKDAETGVEACELAVIKGYESNRTPSDPAYGKQDIISGTFGNGEKHDFPLWRVSLNGVNIEDLTCLFTVVEDYNSAINTAIKMLNNTMLSKSGGTMAGDIDMGGKGIHNIPRPSSLLDAVPKGYVDDAMALIPTIQVGTATIEYKTSKEKSVTVTFPEKFLVKPVVMVSQVFNSMPIVVFNEDVTTSGFTAWVGAVGADGSRDFSWAAIGLKRAVG